MSEASGTSAATGRGDVVAAAAARVTGVAGAAGAARLTGGASRETWALDLGDAPVVARLALDGVRGVSLETEAAAITAAHSAGAPVPEVLGVGPAPELGGTLMVMRRVCGETIARRILRDEEFAAVRPLLARRLGEAAALVHAAAVPDLVPAGAVGDAETALVEEYLPAGAEPPSGLAVGLRWLREHRPPVRGPVLVHGDLRLGNVMVAPDPAAAAGGLVAVLDWELVHVGNPLEDLGWLCAKVWRFGAAPPVGGLGSREDLLDGYESVAGWRPTLAELRWWELWGTVRWGLMCGVMAERHLSGAERSVELVAIGRRAAEQEHDVLLELGHGVPDPGDADPPTDPTPGVHGRPTAVDLLDGVRGYLAEGPLRLPGAAGFEARVALGVVDTVARELRRAAADAAHAALLADLGCTEDADLARAVRTGSLDDRWPDVLAAVADGVHRRVRVVNPRH